MKRLISLFLTLTIITLSVPIFSIPSSADEESSTSNIELDSLEDAQLRTEIFIQKLAEYMVLNSGKNVIQDIWLDNKPYPGDALYFNKSEDGYSAKEEVGQDDIRVAKAKLTLIPLGLTRGGENGVTVSADVTSSRYTSAGKELIVSNYNRLLSKSCTDKLRIDYDGRLSNQCMAHKDDTNSAIIIPLNGMKNSGHYFKNLDSYLPGGSTHNKSGLNAFYNLPTLGVAYYNASGICIGVSPIYVWESLIANSDFSSTTTSPFQTVPEAFLPSGLSNKDADTIAMALQGTSVDPLLLYRFIQDICRYYRNPDAWEEIGLSDHCPGVMKNFIGSDNDPLTTLVLQYLTACSIKGFDTSGEGETDSFFTAADLYSQHAIEQDIGANDLRIKSFSDAFKIGFCNRFKQGMYSLDATADDVKSVLDGEAAELTANSLSNCKDDDIVGYTNLSNGDPEGHYTANEELSAKLGAWYLSTAYRVDGEVNWERTDDAYKKYSYLVTDLANMPHKLMASNTQITIKDYSGPMGQRGYTVQRNGETHYDVFKIAAAALQGNLYILTSTPPEDVAYDLTTQILDLNAGLLDYTPTVANMKNALDLPTAESSYADTVRFQHTLLFIAALGNNSDVDVTALSDAVNSVHDSLLGSFKGENGTYKLNQENSRYYYALAYDHAASIARFVGGTGAEIFKEKDGSPYYIQSYLNGEGTRDEETASISTFISSDLEVYKALSNSSVSSDSAEKQKVRTLSIRKKILWQLATSNVPVSTIEKESSLKELSNMLKVCKEAVPGTEPGLRSLNLTGLDLIPVKMQLIEQLYPEFLTTPTGDYFAYLIYLLTETSFLANYVGEDIGAIWALRDSVTKNEISDTLAAISGIYDVLNFIWYTPSCNFLMSGEYYRSDGENPTFKQIYDFCVRSGFLNAGDYINSIYDDTSPLTSFWQVDSLGENAVISADWYKGRSLSATYIPLQTNVYDPNAMLDIVDTDWIQDYHYKWGFYRKALYIDTAADAAQTYAINKGHGNLRICTLNDLFHPEADIVLYLDTGFYNAQELAKMQDKSYNLYSSSDTPAQGDIFGNIGYFISHFGEIDIPSLLKTDGIAQYSRRVGEGTSDMFWTTASETHNTYDGDVLTGGDILRAFKDTDDYTPLLGFAVVSNIYRDKANYNLINRISSKNKPVFISSSQLACMYDSAMEFNTLYNYAFLKNLEGMQTVGYDNTLDLDEPIFMDIYGNILTESGLVVIPAACNATIHRETLEYTPSAIGFLSSYGSSWKIPHDWELDQMNMSRFFKYNPTNDVWDIKGQKIQGTSLNWAMLSYSSKAAREGLRDWYLWDITQGALDDQLCDVQIIHEVLRGAPIENIDFQEENIKGERVTKSGIIAAAKLDNIIKDIHWDDDNSILSTPTLSFIDNYEIVVTIIFKILLVIIIIALMITLIGDIVQGKVSWKTLFSCLATLGIGVGSVLIIPVSFDISYYESNRFLLQDEAEYIMMYNMEKQMGGVEVGVTSVDEAKRHTKILLKLDNYEFDWWDHLGDVVFGDSVRIMQEEYKKFLENSFLSGYEKIQLKSNGAYIDVQDIFDTSYIDFNTTTKNMYQVVGVDPVTSFYSPYYYFLDSLLAHMNDYNTKNDIYAYSTKLMRGGKVKTVNLVDAYFKSPEFMEGDDDYLALYQLLDVETSVAYTPVFSETQIEQASRSQWNAVGMLQDDEFDKRIQKVYQHMREWVEQNRNLIGKVTDETFIKTLAMDCAVYYNNLFGSPYANGYEVYNLSNTDLLRLSIASKEDTLQTSPMSFARFAASEAGVFGTYSSVFLVMVTMLTSFTKAVVTVGIMAVLIASIYIQKILLRGSNHPIGGYLITLLVICSTNILYALLLKFMLFIPSLGVAPALCIIFQILIQLAYCFILISVLSFALRDWRNFGMSLYQPIINKVGAAGQGFADRFRERFHHNKPGRHSSPARAGADANSDYGFGSSDIGTAPSAAKTADQTRIDMAENTRKKNEAAGTNKFR